MRILLPRLEESILHNDVSWSAFSAFLADSADRSALRITYDRGKLEIVSPGRRHEAINRLLAEFVAVLCDITSTRYLNLGSVTLLRPDVPRAIESDTCFAIQSAGELVGGDELDLERDPPPDLAIEIDITKRCLPRLPIYASIGIPEIWRYSDKGLEACKRRADGDYVEIESSVAFPWLRVSDLVRFVELRREQSDLEIVRAFRSWARGEWERLRQPGA